MDGKYICCANTPMGALNGTVTLECRGSNVMGTVEIMGMRNSFSGVKVSENQCNFKGNFNTPLGNIDYQATCVVKNNMLELTANTNKGNFKLNGKRS